MVTAMRGHHRALALVLPLALVTLGACVELPEVARGACGNGVVEPDLGEDCDVAGPGCGAPDTAAACRFRCDELGGATCPAGAACGLDGVCRVPSGQFTAAAPLRWSSPSALVGDATRDGYPELIGVGASTMEVRLGTADATYATAFTAPNLTVTEAPRLADLDGDGGADVIMPVSIGLFAAVGDPLVVMQPLFQTSFPLDAVGRVTLRSVRFTDDNDLPISEVLLAVRIAQGPLCELAEGCQVLLFGDGGAAIPAGQDVERLAPAGLAWAPSPIAKNVVAIALAFADDPDTVVVDEGALHLYLGNTTTEELLPVGAVTLPGRVLHGAWFADVDGDLLSDLLVSVSTLTGEQLVVAWGNAAGGFEPPQPLIDHGMTGTRSRPLAFGDLDGDGRADVVTTTEIQLNDCAGRACTFTRALLEDVEWSGAVIADVNGDGRVDVGARDGTTAIDVRLGTAIRGLYNGATVIAPGEVVELLAGDYDGNGHGDLAFVTRLPDVAGSDQLHVAFGMPGAPPQAPTYMGDLGTLLAVDNASAPVPGLVDAIDDLVVINALGEATGGTLVLGSTSRRLAAPLIPLTTSGGGDSFSIVGDALAVALDDDPYTDVIALVEAFGGIIYEQQVRVYGSDALGALVERTAPGQAQIPVSDFNLFSSEWAALGRHGDTPAQIVGADVEGRVVAVGVDCPSAEACTATAPVVLGARDERGPATVLAPLDLDGDGDEDLLGGFYPVGDRDPALPAAASIWRNDGGLDPASREDLVIPPGHFVLGAAAIDLELDGTLELLLVTRDDPTADDLQPGGVYLARAGEDGRYGALTAFDPLVLAGVDVTSGLTVTVEDLNGDRLPDVVLLSGPDRANPQTLAVALQLESRPGSVVVSSP
jgi:hypothetical protein